MINIDKVRSDTLGIKESLFFNSAGASLPSKSVTEIVTKYLSEEALIGGYRYAEDRAEDIATFYQEAAIMLRTATKNIAYCFNATDGYGKALGSIKWQSGDIILTTDDDYVSNQLQLLLLQERYGVIIKRMRNLESGDLDLESVENLLKHNNVKLVSISHIPTSSGLIQDVESVGRLINDDTIYLVDACQSAGQIPLDVGAIGCDFLVTSGRKFLRGPRGTGLMFVSDKILNQNVSPATIDGVSADWTGVDSYELKDSATRYELFEHSPANKMGLTEAIRYMNEVGIENIEAYNQDLSTYLRNILAETTGVTVLDKGSKKASIVTFRKEGKDQDIIKQVFDDHHVMYSISSKGSAFFDYSKKGIDWAVRLSPHYFNTKEEMDLVGRIIDTI